MENTALNHNSATVLSGLVTEMVAIRRNINSLKDDKKDLTQDLKDKNLPVAELLSLAKNGEDKLQKRADKLRKAGSILGVMVFAEAVEPDGDRDDDVDNVINEIIGIDVQIADANKEYKALKKEAKSSGFVPSVVEELVDDELDPDAAQRKSASYFLRQTYLKALEDLKAAQPVVDDEAELELEVEV